MTGGRSKTDQAMVCVYLLYFYLAACGLPLPSQAVADFPAFT